MEVFEQGEQLYVLTAVSNLHKLYIIRQILLCMLVLLLLERIRSESYEMGSYKLAHG